jgi:hypothetical protein
MSLAFKSETTQEYATRTEIHYMLRVSMSAIAKAIREEKLAIHLIAGKIQINIDEPRRVFGKSKTDLFK